MSYRETLSLAHTAQCKLQLAAKKPDRNLRFILGHALTVDSLNLRLVQISEEGNIIQQPSHSDSVKFKAPRGSVLDYPAPPGRRKSPPPHSVGNDAVSGINEKEEKEQSDEDLNSDSDHEELSLTRFASGAAQPPRHPTKEQPAPIVDQFNEDSSSDEEELEDFLELIRRNLNQESLEKITKSKTDETLATLYNSVRKCPCHKTEAPELEKFWEVPVDQKLGGVNGFNGVKFAITEIKV
jgi:hypothetical protein